MRRHRCMEGALHQEDAGLRGALGPCGAMTSVCCRRMTKPRLDRPCAASLQLLVVTHHHASCMRHRTTAWRHALRTAVPCGCSYACPMHDAHAHLLHEDLQRELGVVRNALRPALENGPAAGCFLLSSSSSSLPSSPPPPPPPPPPRPPLPPFPPDPPSPPVEQGTTLGSCGLEFSGSGVGDGGARKRRDRVGQSRDLKPDDKLYPYPA